MHGYVKKPAPMKSTIATITSFEILDSRGNPTIKTIVTDDQGNSGWACVPSGASTGAYEAVELRDNDERYLGRGVRKALDNISSHIAPVLTGLDCGDLKKIDTLLIELDGTPNKSRLGANAILAVSLACCRLAAQTHQQELFEFLHDYYFPQKKMVLPRPMTNVLNGGAHANNSTDLQEFMFIPTTTETFAETYRVIAEIYQHLRSLIKKKGWSTTVGDEGGFAPRLSHNKEALELILYAIKDAGLTPGRDVVLALDAAASVFFRDGQYCLTSENRMLKTPEFVSYFTDLCKEFPIASLEDVFDEDDWQGFIDLTAQIGDTVQIVGDDLFVTTIEKLKEGIAKKAGNAILIKPNQIGTLWETVQAIETAQTAGFRAIISHRSGETEDPFIADLAVSSGCGQIKTGAPARSERTVKYNRLVEIEAKTNLPMARFPYSGYATP